MLCLEYSCVGFGKMKMLYILVFICPVFLVWMLMVGYSSVSCVCWVIFVILFKLFSWSVCKVEFLQWN
jgi:hypothetical protein